MHSNCSAKTTTIKTDRSVWVYDGLSLLCGSLWQVSHSSISTPHPHPHPPIMAKPFQFLPPCLFDGNPSGTGKHGNLSQAWELVFYSIKLVSRTALEWYRLTWWPRCPEANTKLWTHQVVEQVIHWTFILTYVLLQYMVILTIDNLPTNWTYPSKNSCISFSFNKWQEHLNPVMKVKWERHPQFDFETFKKMHLCSHTALLDTP